MKICSALGSPAETGFLSRRPPPLCATPDFSNNPLGDDASQSEKVLEINHDLEPLQSYWASYNGAVFTPAIFPGNSYSPHSLPLIFSLLLLPPPRRTQRSFPPYPPPQQTTHTPHPHSMIPSATCPQYKKTSPPPLFSLLYTSQYIRKSIERHQTDDPVTQIKSPPSPQTRTYRPTIPIEMGQPALRSMIIPLSPMRCSGVNLFLHQGITRSATACRETFGKPLVLLWTPARRNS